MAGKLELKLPKLVIKMGPDHGLPFDELLKVLKSNSVLVKAIVKWQKCLNSTILVQFVSQDGLLTLCQYHEKLNDVHNQISSILVKNAANDIVLTEADRPLVRLCAHLAWDSSVHV